MGKNMKKIYVCARKLNDKCIYSIAIETADNNLDYLTGHFSIQRPERACMYAADIINLRLRNDNEKRIYNFETNEATDCVKKLRNYDIFEGSYKNIYSKNIELIKKYVDKNFHAYRKIRLDDYFNER